MFCERCESRCERCEDRIDPEDPGWKTRQIMYAEKGWTFAQFHGENEFFFSTVVAWALMESGSILPVTQDGPTLQEQHDEDAWLFHESERPTDDALRAEAVRVKAARNRRRAEYEERTKKKAATS